MSTIEYKLSERSQMILMVLFEKNEKIEKQELRMFMALSSPMISGSYKEAFNIFPNAAMELLNSGLPSNIRLFNRELGGMQYMGLIEIEGDMSFDFDYEKENVYISLTEEGERIAKALVKNRNPIFRPQVSSLTTVFIACAFGHPEIDELSSKYFFSACENLGYEAVRVDMTEPSQTITERIMEGITEAACVIADLTYARPSVYFEVGYSVGLGIPLLLTSRKDHLHGKKDAQRVHFDLEQYKISFWEQDDSGEFQWLKSMEPFTRLSLILPSRNH
jgi:hypothetical protein